MAHLHTLTGSKCIICDEISKDKIIFHKTRRQTHSLCLDCTIHYLKPIIKKQLYNMKFNIRKHINILECPGSYTSLIRNKCKCYVDISNIKIPNCSISDDFYKLQLLATNYCLVICQNDECKNIIDVDETYASYKISCIGGCNLDWCKYCLVSPFHENKTCLEHELEIHKNDDNITYLFELQEKGTLKYCPTCRTPCLKNNGCNKVICELCGNIWCWLCMEINIDYIHYNSNTSLCNGKLWEGVIIN